MNNEIKNNNNSNNNKYNNEHSTKIYSSVFNNSYLKRLIFNESNKFIILSVNIRFKSIEEWDQFKYKQYLNNITLLLKYNLYQLPDNIKHITIEAPSIINYINNEYEIIKVPNHIESVRFIQPIEIQLFKNPQPYISKLSYVSLQCDRIPANTLPHQINITAPSLPNTIVHMFDSIDKFYDPTNTLIRAFRLSDIFESPLSSLQLHDKSNFEYLHLGNHFGQIPAQAFQISDIPTPYNIKILELGKFFTQTINLELFQNLETIIFAKYSNPTI